MVLRPEGTSHNDVCCQSPFLWQVDVLKEAKQCAIDRGYLSVPTHISWTTANDETAHGYYYPPQVSHMQALQNRFP